MKSLIANPSNDEKLKKELAQKKLNSVKQGS